MKGSIQEKLTQNFPFFNTRCICVNAESIHPSLLSFLTVLPSRRGTVPGRKDLSG
jgi:hypothetical protein